LEEFAAGEAVLDIEPLTPLGEARVFFAFVADGAKWDSIAERLSDLGIHYRTGTTIKEGWERWALYLEEDQLSTVIDHLEAAGNDVKLARNVALTDLKGRPQLEFTRFLDELTPRQREVLATAIGLGYYDHGGDVSIECVAEELDLGTTTVWEHLSRAEAKVMGGLAHHLEG